MAKEKDKVKYKGGLTKRWILQTSTIIVAVLLILCIIAAYFIHSYYYSTAKRKIESYASSIVDIYFENYASTDDKVFEKAQENTSPILPTNHSSRSGCLTNTEMFLFRQAVSL